MLDSIWFRLPEVAEKAKRLRVELPQATELELPFEDGLISGRCWGGDAAGPTVYLVHGWGGWGLQLAAFVPPLLDAGFRVIAFDAPSHGDSAPGREGPKRSSLPELADAFQAVVAAYGPAYGVIAHSLGAAAVMLALRDGLSARKIVFLATATDFRDGLAQYRQHLGFGPRVQKGFLRLFTRKFGPMEGYAAVPMIDALAEERELPALLAVHDRSDRETSAEGSANVVAVWPGARLHLTDGLGHNRILRDPMVVGTAITHLSTERAAAEQSPAVQETMRG
ncbi:alpha/beta fold hydrolase [Kribbella sp. CA-293567]|uniref:alpha/beta fold hydrolase n=1 Tax=Kribbella sp. CA-293567 TaxID=3002436 RepID=UPI0022DDB6E5|nr:alpha/beta fold hydrolase [Kribbella sp. CA-293567]WBQ03601.1 alpha/beta fold hydrolase [Kribbella sp. CA-293567]